jgi:hypothetical protein
MYEASFHEDVKTNKQTNMAPSKTIPCAWVNKPFDQLPILGGEQCNYQGRNHTSSS